MNPNPSNPRTPRQVSQRLLFASITKYTKKVSQIINEGYRKAATAMTERNLFAKTNNQSFVDNFGAEGEFSAVYLQFAKGGLTKSTIVRTVVDEGDLAAFHIADSPSPYAGLSNHKLVAYAINAENGTVGERKEFPIQIDFLAHYTMTASFSNQNLNLVVFIKNTSTNEVSDSTFTRTL